MIYHTLYAASYGRYSLQSHLKWERRRDIRKKTEREKERERKKGRDKERDGTLPPHNPLLNTSQTCTNATNWNLLDSHSIVLTWSWASLRLGRGGGGMGGGWAGSALRRTVLWANTYRPASWRMELCFIDAVCPVHIGI